MREKKTCAQTDILQNVLGQKTNNHAKFVINFITEIMTDENTS